VAELGQHGGLDVDLAADRLRVGFDRRDESLDPVGVTRHSRGHRNITLASATRRCAESTADLHVGCFNWCFLVVRVALGRVRVLL